MVYRGDSEDLVGVARVRREVVNVQGSSAVEVDAVEVGANLVAEERENQYVDAIRQCVGARLTWDRICSGRTCSWEG